MSFERKKILAISGSTRKNSSNEAIIKAIAKFYTQLDITVYDELALLPHFNPDVPDDQVAVTVKRLREEIARADGVIICTPEYVFSLPGALKNAIEWTVPTTVFTDKPLAIIVASGLGEKAFESLLLIMKTLQAKVYDGSAILLQGARSKINANREIADPMVWEEIETVMRSFIGSMNHHDGEPLLN
jgi:NAD(P)H-dependent FMN reductase